MDADLALIADVISLREHDTTWVSDSRRPVRTAEHFPEECARCRAEAALARVRERDAARESEGYEAMGQYIQRRYLSARDHVAALRRLADEYEDALAASPGEEA